MADKRIDQLTAASTMNSADLLVLEQNGTAKKLSGETLGDFLCSNVVDISDTQPDSIANKIWITPSSEEYELAEQSELDSLISRVEKGEDTVLLNWEQGAISSSNGGHSSSSTRIRMMSFCGVKDYLTRVDVASGYKYTLALYSTQEISSYLGMWNGSGLAASATWFTGETVLPKEYDDYYFRIVLAKTSDTAITPVVEEYSNIYIYTSAPLRKNCRLRSTDDLNNCFTNGIYYWTSNSSTPANSPQNIPAVVLCCGAPSNNPLKVQMLLGRTGNAYYRAWHDGSWSSWYRVWNENRSFVEHTLSYNGLESPYNLDNVTLPGSYYLGNASNTEFVDGTNPIAGEPGVLLHFPTMTSDTYGWAQIVIGSKGRMFFRYMASTGWLPWYNVYTSKSNGIREDIPIEEKGISLTYQVSSSSKWSKTLNAATAVAIPIPDGVKKVSLYNETKGCIIAFLRSYSNTSGDSVDFVSQYPSRMILNDVGKLEYRITDEAKYLYILTHATSGDTTPSNVVFYYNYIPEFLQELPVLYLNGDTSTMSKDNAVSLSYSIFGQTGTCTVKWQGSSSQRYVKKNYTIKFDTGFDAWNKWATFVNDLRSANGNISTMSTTSRWGSQTKYCTKANWIDPSAARNIVCARLWGQIVKSRVTAGDINDGRADAPNYGGIDGFPIEIRINNETAGLYTMNIPKDGWQFAMGEGSAEYVISGESNSSNACKWKATANVDGEDYSVEYAPDGVEASTIAASLNTAISAALNAGENWETDLASYLDVDSVIDYFIFTCCVNNHDALARNILYGTYDGTKWFMSAYDLDTTFGVDPYGTTWFDVVNDRNQFAEAANMHRLAYLMYTYSKTKLKTRYQELRSGILSEANVWKELSNYIVNIPSRDYEIDRNRWPSMMGTTTANMAQYMEYYRMHCAYLDAEIAAL